MINRDWERFGEDIRRTVQNAIDSQDFGKLNQTITNTINDAVDSIANNIKNAQGNQRYRGYGRPGGNGDARGAAEPGSESFVRQEYSYGGQPPYAGQTAHPYHPYQEKKLPKLFRRMSSIKTGGILMTVMGGVTGGVCSVLFLITLIVSFVSGIYGIPEIMATALFLILMVSGFILWGCGTGLRARVRRFQTYIQILGQREYCNIRELADKSKKNIKYVVKDLEYMLSKKWFLEGHLDAQKTCLIVSHGMYREYLQIEADRKQTELEELRRDTWEQRTEEDTGREQKEDRQKETEVSGLPPEVQKVIEEGDAYIRKIHACNDAIPGEAISAKISRMEMLIDKIFDRVEQDPECIDDIHKLMEYYLPTTVKLLEAYRELASQPVDGENIRSSKKEIEDTLDTLNVAFEKLLDGMFQETAWDVSSDISVLHTLLAQEGLTDDGLRKI